MNIFPYYDEVFPNTPAVIDISNAASTLSMLAADLLRAPDETERIVATISEVIAELNKTSEALIPADSPATVIGNPLADRSLTTITEPLAADNDESESLTVSVPCRRFPKLTT
jgi:hypothetical protein